MKKSNIIKKLLTTVSVASVIVSSGNAVASSTWSTTANNVHLNDPHGAGLSAGKWGGSHVLGIWVPRWDAVAPATPFVNNSPLALAGIP